MTIQMFRYAVVGFATYVFFISLTSFLVSLDLDPSGSIVIAYVLGTFFSYVVSTKWVYETGNSTDLFFGWKSVRYLIAVAFNLVLIFAINRFLLMHMRSESLAIAIAPVVSTVINFFIMKQVVFRKKPSHQL